MKKGLKKILLVLLIVVVLIVIGRIYLFVKANIIESKVGEILANNDYHTLINLDSTRRMEQWFTKKYAKRSMILGVEDSAYGNSMDFWEDHEKNMYIQEAGNQTLIVQYLRDNENGMLFQTVGMNSNDFITGWSIDILKEIYKGGDIWCSLMMTFVYPLMTVNSITTENINDIECYVIEAIDRVIYIEKDTYYPVKLVNNANVSQPMTTEFIFEPIKKEMLDFPNLEEYYIKVY